MKNIKILTLINLFILFQFSYGFSLHKDFKKHQYPKDLEDITPNNFSGSDIERIQAAIDSAQGTTNKVVIPSRNSNGSNIWKIDHAILLPSNMTVIIDNATIQLSDKSRDNMFRSNNVGTGITDPKWNHDISIIGIGDVLLKGTDNPRSTGDAAKRLSLNPTKEIKETGNYHISYGSDAGKKGVKQSGDWRNIMILMAYVDGYTLKNVKIENAHGWSISNERVVNTEISNIRFNNPPFNTIGSTKKVVRNRDGINLRHGCKNFRINDVSGITGDDFIALSLLGLGGENLEGGTLISGMVTSKKWRGPKDNIEDIYITNITAKSDTRAIAIRANDLASINNVYINGVIFKGGENALLVGGSGYGSDSQPGKINNIYAMNIIGNGRSLIEIEAPVANCYFVNGIFRGNGDNIITYDIKKSKTENVIFKNMIKVQ